MLTHAYRASSSESERQSAVCGSLRRASESDLQSEAEIGQPRAVIAVFSVDLVLAGLELASTEAYVEDRAR